MYEALEVVSHFKHLVCDKVVICPFVGLRKVASVVKGLVRENKIDTVKGLYEGMTVPICVWKC